MKSHRIALLLLATSALLTGCSSEQTTTAETEQQAIDRVIAPFAQGAITASITAEPDMNAWNEIANSCVVLLIQAQKASVLNKMLSSPAQLKVLFSGAGTEDDILKVDRYAAMPGQQTTLHIDRSENTRVVAIVAGYYPFPKKQHMAIVSIPVTVTSSGWWTKKWSAELAPLNIAITLGSQSITQLKKNSLSPDVQTPTEPRAVQHSPDDASAQGEK